jgi:biotin carboxyl carrier protein
MNHFRLAVDDKSYEIEILNDPRAAEVQVKVDGNLINVKLEDLSIDTSVAASSAPVSAPVLTAPTAAASGPVASSSNTVAAPLPGKIHDIKVRSGQTVKANDPLVVIEAMKAMNVIRAQRDGKIGKIYVSVGGHVAYGASLLDIE